MYGVMTQLCALAALAGVTGSPEDPSAWLDRMAHAVENLSYQGTFVHITDGSNSVETMRIIHRVADGKVSERLISLNGGREIIRNDDEVRCVLKGEKSVVVDRYDSPLRAALPVHREDLEDFYRFLVVGRESVIERPTRVIEVRPRDEFRYGHRLWLDEATAMPLRSALIDEQGDIVEQVLFTSISLDETIPDKELKPALETGQGYKWFVDNNGAGEVDNGDWRAESLPDGFRLTVARTNATGEVEKEHYVYTDGLATVSVFVEQASSETSPLKGVSTLGSANAYVTTIDGYQITAVGEVPPSTVEMIGASLRRRR